MLAMTEKILTSQLANHVFSDNDLEQLLDGTRASRYGLVNKALAKGELTRLRRGLYVLSDRYRRIQFSKFFLASRIASHSYISLESALSFHGWIPEKVVAVYSVTAKRSCSFESPMGEFIYYHLPINELFFFTGVTREESGGKPFLIASPLRALADLVYVKKHDWHGLDFLTDSLRIDHEHLMQLKREDFNELKAIYRSTRVLNFLTKLQHSLK